MKTFNGEFYTKEYIKSLMTYNPVSGIFRWKERPVSMFKDQSYCDRWNKRYAGNECGNNYDGSLSVEIKSCGKFLVRYRLKQVAWFLMTGKWINKLFHINGDLTDNRFVNLRDVSNLKHLKDIGCERKHCKICNDFKPYSDFRIAEDHDDGFRSSCKRCDQDRRNDLRRDNYEHYRKVRIAYDYKNRRRINRYMKEYRRRPDVVESLKKYRKEYFNNNKKLLNEKRIKKRNENIEFYRKRDRDYKHRNPEAYARNILAQKCGLRSKDIPQELVDLKRVQILIHREIYK